MAGVPLSGRPARWILTWPLWPQALLFVAFLIAPVAMMALASLHANSGAWTASNYTAFALDPYNRAVILRTLAIGVATTLITLVLGYPLARAIARGPRVLRWLLSGLVFFPLLTSSVIRSFGWLVLLADNGIFNNALAFVGLPRTHLIFNAYGVTIALAQVLLPFMVLSLVSAMANIDPAIEEAATTLVRDGRRSRGREQVWGGRAVYAAPALSPRRRFGHGGRLTLLVPCWTDLLRCRPDSRRSERAAAYSPEIHPA